MFRGYVSFREGNWYFFSKRRIGSPLWDISKISSLPSFRNVHFYGKKTKRSRSLSQSTQKTKSRTREFFKQLPWEPTTFIFRGCNLLTLILGGLYNAYIKPSIFMGFGVQRYPIRLYGERGFCPGGNGEIGFTIANPSVGNCESFLILLEILLNYWCSK